MSTTVPAKRNTRLNSKIQAPPIREEMTELVTKRNLIVSNIRKLQKQFEEKETFAKWSKGDLSERVKRLEALGSNLNENNIEMVCKDERTVEIEHENDELELMH